MHAPNVPSTHVLLAASRSSFAGDGDKGFKSPNMSQDDHGLTLFGVSRGFSREGPEIPLQLAGEADRERERERDREKQN